VGVLHGAGERFHQPRGLAVGLRRAGEFLGETTPFEVLQREEGAAITQSDLVNLYDVRVLQACGPLLPRPGTAPGPQARRGCRPGSF